MGKAGKQSSLSLVIVMLLTLIVVISTLLFLLILFTGVTDLIDARNDRAALVQEAQAQETLVQEATITNASAASAFDAEMREINKDYICWLKIDGTLIDYPVVRGNDNEKYLDVSFLGEENQYGSIFMDYRNAGANVPHIIIYGHNTITGDMFSGLHKFLDEQYKDEHPVITLKANNRIVSYEIFSARKTDVDDPAYYLDFTEPGSFAAFAERCGASEEATQILTLSTCVSAGDDNERVVVQGFLLQGDNQR